MFEMNTVFADRYLLKELLGRGGSSEVWIAEDIISGNTPEVVKIFAPETGLSEASLKLFRKDFEQIGYLSHPGLLPVTFLDATQHTPFLVMPYMHEGSAQALLDQEGPFPEEEIALIMKQIGSALHYLHTQSQPVLHQNLDPEKILLTSDGHYVLTDYGISRATRQALHKATGRVSGLAFAAPERFLDKPEYKEAGDIFSLGVILYTLCSGHTPWEGTGGLSLLQGAEVPDLPSSYSRVLNHIIKSCLSVDQQKRPTAKQLEVEGKYYLANKTWRPTANIYDMIEQPKAPGTPLWLKAATATVIILLGLFLLLEFPPDKIKEYWNKQAIVSDQQADDEPDAIVLQERVHAAGTAPEKVNAKPVVKKQPVPKKEIRKEPEKPAAPVVTTKPETAQAKPAVKEAVTDQSETIKEEEEVVKLAEKVTETTPAASLQAYLNNLANPDLSMNEREKLRPKILSYFSDKAQLFDNSAAAQEPFSREEFIDILLSIDSTSTVRVDSMEEDEKGKIEKLHFSIEDKL